jgi:predicted AAA+ superfamily ATPase
MAISNYERVGKALELLKNGLQPFVEREIKAVFGDKGIETLKATAGGPPSAAAGKDIFEELDCSALLKVMWDCWNDVFSKTLGHAGRSLVSELRDVRNKWAHQQTFSTDDAYRALDSMQRLLIGVSAAKEAEELERQKAELLRLKFDEQARHEKRKAASTAIESQAIAGLRPWRDVVTPHPDVASGRYQQAEFAADLWQVYKSLGSDEYRNPVEFFRRTYLTAGLKDLLVRSLFRLNGKGGDPVVELQTNFGGGKTHSMLALYHLFSGAPMEDLVGLEAVFTEAKLSPPSGIRRVVLVGNRLSPGQPERKDDGTVVRTVWGELAWQLGGKDGYAMVQQADETATNPGDALGKLIRKYSPCLILIDEWVAYARQLHDTNDLPGGDFETQFTFAQTLSEEMKSAKQALLVVSIPASSDGNGASPTAGIHDEEVGGAKGREALARLRNVFQRVATQWRPASSEESYEIVRRRLFQPITDPQMFVARDRAAKEFCDLYRTQHQEFPPECREADYENKITAAYPIHPEVFDRLYQDWAGLVKFQRTRGVLRLMASVIHTLWERDDRSVLILPANLPVDDLRVQSELTRYLSDGWDTVIEKDVDGENSLPLKVDREKPNLGRYSATRRVARSVFLGSAPTPHAANKGIEDRRLKLGCVQPGESPAVFGDALRHLAHSATYLYQDGNRYWYSTQPTVTKLADDRAEQLNREPDKAAEEIRKRVREELRNRGDFAKVHPFAKSGEVPDEMEARLVVLDLDHPYAKDPINPALVEAESILNTRGNSQRIFRNALIFLAADRARLDELMQATRYFLAWQSIENDRAKLNLDNHQSRQATTQRETWHRTVEARVYETFVWLLVPTQPNTQKNLEWLPLKVTGQDTLSIRASKKLRSESQMVSQYASSLLRGDMDKIPLWRGNHVAISQLLEDYARYPYLQRTRGPEVILRSMQDGIGLMMWSSETFAYAESWDETKQRYVGLQGGKMVTITPDCTGLLVKSEIAAKQIEAERPKVIEPTSRQGSTGTTETEELSITGNTTGIITPPVQPTKFKRFHATVKLDSARIGRDAGRIAEEIVQHLALLPDATLEIIMEIQAEIPNGAPDTVMRTVTENCRTLKFSNQAFEKE